MSIKLAQLPYELDALEPMMSRATLETHYGKHHQGYINKLNGLIEGTPYEGSSLREIVVEANRLNDTAVFNNAAQAWNHELFWNSMSPEGDNVPDAELQNAIARDFGNIDTLKDEFRFSAKTLFGSGWVWLVSDAGRLRIVASSNADTPITGNAEPLLVLDVWEHAYYLDVRNDRSAYIDSFLDKLIDWSAASQRYESIRKAA